MMQTVSVNAEDRPPPRLRRIQRTTGWASLKLHELWNYRELLYFLVWRDVKVRYKQTMLGAAWALIQPFMSMVVFSVFFGQLLRVPSDTIPYPIFAYSALLPWIFFTNGVGNAAVSLVANGNLIKKVYFPRMLIPLASVLTGLVDFAFAFVVLLALMVFYQIPFTATLLWLPVLVLIMVAATIGIGLWFAAINVRFRDVRYTVPFLLQFGMFVSPVVYSSTLITNPLIRIAYALNPMTGVIDGFRWMLSHTRAWPDLPALISGLVALFLLAGGAYAFRRMERNFSDIL